MGAAIRAELAPIVTAAGWVEVKGAGSRTYTYWWSRFYFTRVRKWRIEVLDIGYKYGWRARVRTHYFQLVGDEGGVLASGQGDMDGRWAWPTFGAWTWRIHRLFNPAPDTIRFAMEDAKQQLLAIEHYSATAERPARRDFHMESKICFRPWFDDERAQLAAAGMARGPRPDSDVAQPPLTQPSPRKRGEG